MIRKCLAVGIILLFVGTCIIPAIAQETEKPLPASRGNWLYVGGSGPGNYSRIQDAIANASDGDTVFIYSGIYYEHLIIDKAICLMGEQRQTTIVDGQKTGTVMMIPHDSIVIQGITVQNSGQGMFDRGVVMPSNQPFFNNITIEDCIIQYNYGGILFDRALNSSIIDCFIHNNSGACIDILEESDNILVKNCSLCDNGVSNIVGGLCCYGNGFIEVASCVIRRNNAEGIGLNVDRADIHDNIIDANKAKGIFLSGCWGPYEIMIHNNVISNTTQTGMWSAGIFIQDCTRNIQIENNSFLSNINKGVYLLRSRGVRIQNNNFIGNSGQASFLNSFFNHWLNNYWDDWNGLGPYRIPGGLLLFLRWFQFDWHPAGIPYDFGEINDDS